MVKLLLSKASASLENYLSNFNFHPGSLLQVFPPIRVLMSQKEQLSIFEGEPELDRSRNAGASALGGQVEVRRFFENNLTSSQPNSQRTTSLSDPVL